MGAIEDNVGGTAFDPQTVRIMGQAYDSVVRQLHDRGQPQVVREVIAKRITDLATLGERNSDRLAEIVLSELGLVVRP